MKKYILISYVAGIFFTGCDQTQKESSAIQEVKQPGANDRTNSEKSSTAVNNTTTMYPELSNYIESVLKEMDSIPQDRKNQLRKIALFLQTKKQTKELASIIFICTHNSRRSHLSQIWATTAASYYGIQDGIKTYSGGTEATAFNPRAIAAMERAGFKIQNPGGENPHYLVRFGENSPTMECFSKKYDDESNAKENFVAVMTCSQADKNCPIIPGASLRVPIPYEDPKFSDGKPIEAATYDERCKQIATEMFYLMSQVKI